MASFQPIAGPLLHAHVERESSDNAPMQFDLAVVAAMKSVLRRKVASHVA
jgi:hypothetical protein